MFFCFFAELLTAILCNPEGDIADYAFVVVVVSVDMTLETCA